MLSSPRQAALARKGKTMTTHDIPQNQWPVFFTALSERYRGWNVSIEVMGPDIGDQPEAQNLPFQGITLESKGTEQGDLRIEAGDTPKEFMSHFVDHPQRVLLTESQPGKQTDLEIESEDGYKTLVHLRATPGLPPA